MSENTTTTISLEDTISELVEVAFGSSETITAYKIATIINGTFKVVGFEKQIPPQMMYNYSRNGLINKVKGQKQYGKEDVTTFVTKYVKKQIGQ